MTTSANALAQGIHQLIQFQKSRLSDRVAVNSFQLPEHHFRSENIGNLSQELGQELDALL
jgi:hypothetical protein